MLQELLTTWKSNHGLQPTKVSNNFKLVHFAFKESFYLFPKRDSLFGNLQFCTKWQKTDMKGALHFLGIIKVRKFKFKTPKTKP